jgi:hypothetical protein
MKGKLTRYDSFDALKASHKGVKLSKKELARREKEWRELMELIQKHATVEHMSEKQSEKIKE